MSITITVRPDGTIHNFDEAVAALCASPTALRNMANLYEPRQAQSSTRINEQKETTSEDREMKLAA